MGREERGKGASREIRMDRSYFVKWPAPEASSQYVTPKGCCNPSVVRCVARVAQAAKFEFQFQFDFEFESLTWLSFMDLTTAAMRPFPEAAIP